VNREHPITTLFLDIGGVLLTNGWDSKARKLATVVFNLDAEELEERHNLTFDTYEVGKISLKEYLKRVVFYTDRPFTLTEFQVFMFKQSQPFPDMIHLITQLKEKYRLKVAVVSNEGRELNVFRISTFKLKEFVDFFISSSFVHFRKPDHDIFRIALDTAQVSASEALYIDDRLMFVQAAEELGIKGIHHTGFESTVQKLASYGLEIT
jgi:putative hydrolase of the HAD superfamily